MGLEQKVPAPVNGADIILLSRIPMMQFPCSDEDWPEHMIWGVAGQLNQTPTLAETGPTHNTVTGISSKQAASGQC